MVAGEIRRDRFGKERLMDELFKLMINGVSRDEICKKLNLPERTYYYYTKALEKRIVAEQTAKSREDILMHKELCRERIYKALKGEQKIAEDDKVSPRTRMDAWYRYLEAAIGAFKIEAETSNWLEQYKSLNLKEPIPLAELQEEETTEGEQVSDVGSEGESL